VRQRKSATAFEWDALLRGDPLDSSAVLHAASDPFWQVERRELQATIQRAVSGLPADHRLIFLLKYYQGFSYAEISELLHCPVGTVKSRVHTALVRLKSALSGYRVPERGG
jgi:RNA polymerase sigma-70 factor (ECF subfamily)